MNLISQKINSVEDAKEYFISFDGHHFHMGRDCPDRYNEYMRLNISKDKENEWSYEILDIRLQMTISPETPNENLWAIHSRMVDVMRRLKSKKSVCSILSATENIIKMISSFDKLLVAENLTGRDSLKHGPIYLAYKLGSTDDALKLFNYAIDLIKPTLNSRKNGDRAKATQTNLKDIGNYIGYIK